MTKESLGQYGDLVREYGEVREKIWSINRKIERIEQRMKSIEQEGVVKDKVYGGEGGVQGFVIEGYASGDYSRTKTSLQQQKLLLLNTQATLNKLSVDIQAERCRIEEFIAHIPDSHIRRILNYRLVKGMQWEDIAIRMGGGNTADSVRMAYKRYIECYFG